METKELNLCELLKGCEGMTFYSPIFGDVILININISLGYPITVSLSDGGTRSFYNNGVYLDIVNAECMLFPSKENRDWSTFKKPIKIKEGTPVMTKWNSAAFWKLESYTKYNKSDFIVPVSDFDFTDFDSNKSKSIV